MNNKLQSQVLLYQAPDGRTRLEVRMQDETVWLTQAQMAELFQTTQQNVSLHIRNIYEEGELTPEATHKESLSVQPKGQVQPSATVKEFWNLRSEIPSVAIASAAPRRKRVASPVRNPARNA